MAETYLWQGVPNQGYNKYGKGIIGPGSKESLTRAANFHAGAPAGTTYPVTDKNLITKIEDRLEDHYIILSKLGKGGFGNVYKVQNIETKKMCAMKVVRKQILKFQDDDQKFLKEIEILVKLEHPNIIKMYEYFVDEILLEPVDFRNGAISNFMERRCRYN